MASRFYFHSFVLVWLGVAAGCAKDLGDEIAGETETEIGETGDGDGDGDGGDSPLDATGTYLFALETSLAPDLPLQYVLEIHMTSITDDGATADFTFTPLSLEQGEVTPGECLGGVLTYEAVELDADGNFVLDMGMIPLPNMLVPSEAEIVLHGHLVQPDAMCGDVEGVVHEPLEYDLAGSTFAAIPLDDGCDADPFPAAIFKCSMLGP